MDSGLEECILPSIRRSQILMIYRKGGVVNPETFGQIACEVEVIKRMETLWSGPLRGRETSQEQDNYDCFRADKGSAPTTVFSLNCPGVRLPRLLMCILLTTHTLFSPVSRPSEVLDRKVSIYVCPNGTMIYCGPSTFFIEQCSTAIPATHPLEE